MVDLAALGCIDLSLTQQEQSDAKVDLKDAKEAGVNVDSVEILSEQMMNDVSMSTSAFSLRLPMVGCHSNMGRRTPVSASQDIISGLLNS